MSPNGLSLSGTGVAHGWDFLLRVNNTLKLALHFN